MAALKKIGDIELFAEIHRGAITQVYKGYQAALDRVVLVKVLRPELRDDRDLCQNFEREARLFAKVHHPNIVSIYDFGADESALYFMAEFVDGLNLKELLQHGRLPCDLAWYVLMESARGLHAAHEKGILHGDVKPENILISFEGRVKLSDFGFARSLLPGATEQSPGARGTLGYFSPELIHGEVPGKQSDIFSLGATFFEMLAGEKAFTGKEPREFFHAITSMDPVGRLYRLRDIPVELIDICQKMLAKDPARRYPHCGDLIRDLEAVEAKAGLAVSAPALQRYMQDPENYAPATPTETAVAPREAETAKPVPRKHRRRQAFAALLIAAVIIGAWLLLPRRHNSTANLPLRHSGGNSEQPPAEAVAESTLAASAGAGLLPAQMHADREGTQRPEKTSANPPARDTLATQASPHLRQRRPETRVDTVLASRALGPGFLDIACSPWAAVWLDDDSIGVTPLAAIARLQPGQHKLVLRNPEFPLMQQTVQIAPGDTLRLQVSLWKRVGLLYLEISPWAKVYLDGEYKDTIPPQKRPFILAPGAHNLRLEHPGLGEWTTPITVRAGAQQRLRFNLKELPMKKLEQ